MFSMTAEGSSLQHLQFHHIRRQPFHARALERDDEYFILAAALAFDDHAFAKRWVFNSLAGAVTRFGLNCFPLRWAGVIRTGASPAPTGGNRIGSPRRHAGESRFGVTFLFGDLSHEESRGDIVEKSRGAAHVVIAV